VASPPNGGSIPKGGTRHELLCIMRCHLAIALLAFAPLGCSVYQHEVDIKVQDPHRVWVESGRSAERIDPSGPDAGALLPGTRDHVERTDSGVLRVGGRSVVGRDGSIPGPPATLDESARDNGVFRFPVCYRSGRRGVGCKRSVMLATPWDNVVVAREADVPTVWLGVLEVLGGAGAATAGAFIRSPYSSGGALLIGTGLVAVVAGIVQLAQPVRDERDMLP
jgi:hypothetical protein